MSQQVQKFLKILGICSMIGLAPIAANAQTYCMSTLSCASSDYVNSFSTTGGLTNITNNGSGCTSGGYVYNSTMKHTGIMGTSVGFTIGPGPWSSYMAIYVDWNKNGSFSDAGEQVWTSGSTKISANATTSGTFTVPMTAIPGVTRMRAVGLWSTNPNVPCGLNGDLGESEDYNFEVISPCTAIATVSNATPGSKSVTVNWTAVSGSAGYEYTVSTSTATPTGSGTPTSSTTALITGLNPATNYCVFVRNKCNATSFSQWKSTCFTTSNCSAPTVSFANITENSALAFWSSNPIATSYEYIYTTDQNTPGTGVTGTITTQNSFSMQGLLSETTYYVHIRTHCTGNELSTWETYQFNTTPACEAPEVTMIDISPYDKEATWQPVYTAVAYEYAVNTSQDPPALGNTIYANDVKFSIPNDDKPYYFHLRTKCISIFNTSGWTTVTLREPPSTSIKNVNDNGVQFTAYPNPVGNILTVKLNGVKTYKGILTVSDVTGKLVYTTNLTSSTATIDMTQLAAGSYIIKYADDNTTQILKITKQ